MSWELFDGRAVRRGDWKAVLLADRGMRYLSVKGTGRWQLLDLAADPGEATDLAEHEPQRLAVLVDSWNRCAAAKGVVLPATFAPGGQPLP